MTTQHFAVTTNTRGALGMRIRRTGLATVGVAGLLAALVAVLGAAQAAPSNKKFSATVRVTNGTVTPTNATLTLTLTNNTRSQTLGSANFMPPTGVTVDAIVRNPGGGWNVSELANDVVAFRSTSNALQNGQSVSADIAVTIAQATCAAPPGNAAWTAQGKQSNDFSGTGNDFQFDPQSSDMVALGSFVIDEIETVTDDGQHVPAIVTNHPEESTTTAYDICGEVKTTYSGATRTATLLTGASYIPSTGLDWSDGDGVGDLTITPAVTETDNQLRVSDPASGIFDVSNFFDTTDRLCTSTDTLPCEWSDQGNKLKVNSTPPPEDASLGIGFNSSLSFLCGDATSTVGGTPLVNINPRYEATNVEAIAVTLTYRKSATGNGPASGFDVCFRKDEATTWTVLSQCPNSPAPSAAPCFISRKRVTGGDLEVILWVATDDPWTGLG